MVSKKNSPEKHIAVLQVLPELISGGVERGTVDIAKVLKKEGIASYVASSGGAMIQQVISAGSTHITLPVKSKNPLVMIMNIFRLVRVIKQYDITIVHARSRAPAWSCYFAAKIAKCHFVTTFHGIYSHQNVFKRLYNSIMARGEKVIAVSKFVKHHILKFYDTVTEENIPIIYRGVDTDYFNRKNVTGQRMESVAKKLRIEHDCPVILLPGRITGLKGHDFLLDALKHLPTKEYICLFIGSDTNREAYRRRIEDKITDFGLGKNVRIISNEVDMPALYSQVDIVVSASVRPEAFGRIAVEAQAMERLVIATKHGGSCETILPGETGWLVEPGNVDEMTEALEEAIHLNKAKRSKLTKAARSHVSTYFSLKRMQEQTIAVYRSL